jgi:thiol-disulfide isomerase/thioredoxin
MTMSFARTAASAFLILVLSGSAALAQANRADPAAAGRESFATVKAEYDAGMKQWGQENRAARAAKAKSGEVDTPERTGIKPFRFESSPPGPKYSARFLAIAEKDPNGPEALDAIKMALETSSIGDGSGKSLDTRARAIKILAKHYTRSPKTRALVQLVARYDEPEAHEFIASVVAHHPDRTVAVAALERRALFLRARIKAAANMKKPEAVKALSEFPQYKDHVAQTIAKGEKAREELATIEKILHEQYADIVADLTIGTKMSPLVSEDLDGKTATLDDFKGKVVVLDVWAAWCGRCKKMIPHEREMVARLKEKPFALVSISADAKKQTLTDFLGKEPMPWHHWWNGAEGKLIDALSIEHYPTIFVLDAKGVIRYKNLELLKDPDAELEKAVNELLEETEKKTAGPTEKDGVIGGRTEAKTS